MNLLYILSRTDMASLGRGKAVAQGAHAANQFMWNEVTSRILNPSSVIAPNQEAIAWSQEANGFGTTIALGATLPQIESIVEYLKFKGKIADLTLDPEYPLLDGKTLHILPDIITGAYVFGDKDDLRPFMMSFDLLRNDPL